MSFRGFQQMVLTGVEGNQANVRDLSNSDALNVSVVDANGDHITSFGGTGGTSHTDDDTFSIGSAASITPTGYLADETAPDSVDEGDVGVPRMTLTRKPYAVITDATSEQNAGVDASGHLQVDIAADSVGIGGGTQYTEDAAAAADPVGNAVILVRDDTPGTLVSADGDNVAQRGTNYGAAFCQIVDSSGSFVDSFGGGTQYAVDTALGATPTGTLAIGIRDDALSALTPVEGDAIGLRVDANGALWTHDDALDAALNGTNLSVDWAGTAPPIGAGTEAAALRVTLATDSTGVVSVDDNGGNLSVDWGGTTPPIGAGVEATALRVTVATDSTGILSVDDNGGNLSVDWGGTVPPIGAGTEAAALRVTLATDSTGVVSIDDNSGSLTVDNAGTFATQVDGDALTALQLIDDVVYTDDTSTHATGTSKGALVMAAATPTDGSVDANDIAAVAMSVDRRLHVDAQIVGQDADVTVGVSAGTNLIGDVGISGARTSGGTTLYKNIDVDESEDAVKATAGQVYWIHAVNLSTGVRYLKLYNATVATVVVGTTVPDLTFPIPTNADTNGTGWALSVPNGIAFSTAITIAATTGLADNDSGAPGANDVVVNLGYA